uniref:Uncharacterized protein n=1 Tax=Anguilla anguilla TaxID=7936 RepID=A0A0E9USU7_ANGAN
MFPTGLSSPNPLPPTQEARIAASDGNNGTGNILTSKKRKLNSSEREDIDSISPPPSKSNSHSSSSPSDCSTSHHIKKKLRFEDSVDLIGLDVENG